MSYRPKTERDLIKELEEKIYDSFDSIHVPTIPSQPLSSSNSTFGGRLGTEFGAYSSLPVPREITNDDGQGNLGEWDRVDLISEYTIIKGTNVPNDPPNLNLKYASAIKANGERYTLTPQKGKTLTLKAGGDFDITQDITIGDNQFVRIIWDEESDQTPQGGFKVDSGAVMASASTKPVALPNIELNGAVAIDLAKYSSEPIIVCTITGNSVVTLANVSPGFVSHILNITRNSATVPTLDIEGVVIDFADVSDKEDVNVHVFTADAGNTFFITKKKAKTVPLGVPTNITLTPNDDPTKMGMSWKLQPNTRLPKNFEIRYSTTKTGNNVGGTIKTETVGEVFTKLISGFTANTQYHFQVRAKSDNEYSAWSTISSGRTALPVPQAQNVNFRVGIKTYRSIELLWNLPNGGSINLSRKKTDERFFTPLLENNTSSSHTDSKNLEPNTNYDYNLTVVDSQGRLTSFQIVNEATGNIPPPSISASTVNGVKIRTRITFPVGLNIADIEIGNDANFDANTRINRRTVSRPTKTSQQDLDFTNTSIFNKSSRYYVRARFDYNGKKSSWSAIAHVDTGSIPQASQPRLTLSTSASELTGGQIKIKLRFRDSVSYNDIAEVKYRPSTSIDPNAWVFMSEFTRDNPPAADLDDDEDKIQIIKGGFSSGQRYTFTARVIRPQALPSKTDTRTSGVVKS